MKNYEDQKNEIQEPDLTGSYTARDYISWKTDELMELIKGKVFKMAAAPLWRHQEVLGELHIIFRRYVKNPCKVGLSPVDVFLIHPGEDWKETNNIVQPDLCIICDPEKIDPRGCMGAPDLVVEILSPSTAKKDVGVKRDLYEEYGVKELWIVHPQDATILVHVLQNGKYHILPLVVKGDTLPSPTFPELIVDLDEVFPDE